METTFIESYLAADMNQLVREGKVVKFPMEDGRTLFVIKHRDPLLEHLVGIDGIYPIADTTVVDNIRKFGLYFSQQIRKMTPALQAQWETYNINHSTQSAFNNEGFIASLLNELRFFGAFCRVISTEKPIEFLYLQRSALDDYSCMRYKKKRAVDVIQIDTRVLYFLKTKSKEVMFHSGSKGDKICMANTNLSEIELARLLRKRKSPKKGKEFTYPPDYGDMMRQCKIAYSTLIEKFKSTFWED